MELNRTVFFDLLHGPNELCGHYIDLRAKDIKTESTRQEFVTTVKEVDAFCKKWSQRELYFGVAPRMTRNNGTWENCAAPMVLWVDIDFKDTPEPMAREKLAQYEHPPSIIVYSGGGLHGYWFLRSPMQKSHVKPALQKLVRVLSADELCAHGACILRIPGTLNHKPQYFPDEPVVTVEEIHPERIYDPALFDDGEEVEEIHEYTGPVEDQTAAMVRGRWQMAEWPQAISGQRGNTCSFNLACVLIRDVGLNDDNALKLMLEWNELNQPPWPEASIREFINNAKKYGQGEVGSDDPAKDFEEGLAAKPDLTREEEAEFIKFNFVADPVSRVQRTMQRLDDLFKAVDDNGKMRIYRRMFQPEMERDFWRTYERYDFTTMCQDQLQLHPIDVGIEKPKLVPAGTYWLSHYRERPKYDGIVMMPECPDERTPDGWLNLWRGFYVQPAPGSWELLKSLIFETLCDWDPVSYDYVIQWMAQAVQHPEEPAGTTLVFKGKKGVGKGTLARWFIKMFGHHGMQITSRGLLTGRFNAHLRDCVALFADEAFWAGDKEAEGTLKGLITEPYITYEAKGKDPVTGRNHLHVMMASNNDWVIPAGVDNERRYAVFEAGDDVRSADDPFWIDLDAEMNNGGLAAMLHDLLAMDLSGFNPHMVPQTEALAEQKVQTMDSFHNWLFEVLEKKWGFTDFDAVAEAEKHEYDTTVVYNSYMDYCKKHNDRHPKNQTAFGMALSKTIKECGLKMDRKQKRGGYNYIMPDPEKTMKKLKNKLGIAILQDEELIL